MTSEPSSTDFETRRDDGVTIITVLGPEIVPEARQSLYELADQVAETPEPRWVILNLGHLKAINSATLGVLISLQKRVQSAGGALKLCASDPQVLAVFQITRLDQVLDLHDDENDAIAAFHGKGKAKGKPKPKGQGRSWFSRIFGAK